MRYFVHIQKDVKPWLLDYKAEKLEIGLPYHGKGTEPKDCGFGWVPHTLSIQDIKLLTSHYRELTEDEYFLESV